jgi:hypothetical protein
VVAVEQFTLNTFKRSFDSNGPEAQRVLTQFRMALRQADARILEESTESPSWSRRRRRRVTSGRWARRRCSQNPWISSACPEPRARSVDFDSRLDPSR